MSTEQFNCKLKEIEIEFAVYRRSPDDFVCRISKVATHDGPSADDDYYPDPDLGMLWCRTTDGRWGVSGFLSEAIATTHDDIFHIIDLVGNAVLKEESLAQHHLVEIVRVKSSGFSSGERDGFADEPGTFWRLHPTPK